MIHIFEPAITIPNRSQQRKRKRSHVVPNGSDSSSSSSGDESEESYSSLHDIEKAADLSIESPKFPHAPARPRPSSPEQSSSPKPTQERRNLKHQHLYTLTTVLHKCLREQDYPRASRAFGLLLRYEVGGQMMDLRKNHLWGIGAEILLHRDKQRDRKTGALHADDVGEDQSEVWFTDEGFEAAKMYYERLILQYPYRIQRPRDVGAMQFYPVMFGLWINHVQGRSKRARRKAEVDFAETQNRGSNLRMDVEDDMSLTGRVSSPVADDDNDHEPRMLEETIAAIWIRERQQATEIVERLERLTAIPPYDRASRLLRQQGMVYLWIADLCEKDVDTLNEAQSYRQRARDTFLRIRSNDKEMWQEVKHYLSPEDDVVESDHETKRKQAEGRKRRPRKDKSKE